MARFVVRRVPAAMIQLLLVLLAVFAAVRLTGDPTNMLLGPYATEADHQRLTEVLGLDKPLYEQFGRFIAGLASGDLGRSFSTNQPVAPLVIERLVNSAKLAGVSFGIIIAIFIPLGVVAAKNHGTRLDSAMHIVAVAGFAVPNFLLGILVILVFAVHLNLIPTSGMGSWKHYLGPSLALSTAIGAGMMRLMRSGMLEVEQRQYIQVAHAKGLRKSTVTWRHEFRAALIPVLTYGGMYVGALVGGSVVVEAVFSWPGLGVLTYHAALSRDFPIIQATIIVIGATIIVANLLVDVAYAYVDPRIRVGKG